MSDADLRELERRFRETGSVEDEAAWLRARVQGGALMPKRLSLLAYLGHSASSLVSQEKTTLPLRSSRLSLFKPSTWFSGRSDLDEFQAGLDRANAFEPEEQARVCLACFRVLLAEEKFDSLPVDPLRERQLANEEALLSGQLRPETLVDFADDLSRYYDKFQGRSDGDPPTPWAAWAVGFLCKDSLKAIAHVRAEIVPWALGYGDPVRDRVEARQRAEAARE